ncbi:MAG: tetratricopeptide repeat protein, partial [Desulfuromusa sp.]|nr:tetratricopeptide repeat protein [Desulfuromusa sp.]
GTLLKQVSLVPQKQILQLLVDLVDHATVQSFQLVDGAEQGYHLFIEIVAAAPVAEKGPKLLVDSEPKPIVVGNKEDSVVPKANKNRSRLSRDQQAYQAGLEQLQQGDRVAAEASFNQALLLNPKLEDARLQLIELLQQQMKLVKAEELLQQGLLLAPENPAFRKIYAHLLLNDQRQSEAISLLKTDPLPTVVEDLEYYALLAALLQDTRQFEEASSIYGQLLQVRPQEALWWMGMAISLEQSGHFEPARNAYQEALSLPGLRPDLQNYIQSRVQALSTK